MDVPLVELVSNMPDDVAGLMGVNTELLFNYGGTHAEYIRKAKRDNSKKRPLGEAMGDDEAMGDVGEEHRKRVHGADLKIGSQLIFC